MRVLASEVLVSVHHQTATATVSPESPRGVFASVLEQAQQRDEGLPSDLLELLKRLVALLRERIRRQLGLHPVNASTTHILQTERLDVSARGAVKTADGRELGFTLAVQLQRQETQATPAIALQDPLVLVYDGPAARLTDQRWRFDLDGDGDQESLPGLARGSGMLAFDRDGNHRVDNGKELFGATTGEGFQELKTLDDDGNGWIDEGDQAFDRLVVWQPQDNTPPKTLKELGVGALWTGSAPSPFDMDGGRLRSTGMFLRESGQAGVVQQVDFETT